MNEIQRMLLSSVTFLIQPAKSLKLVVSLVKFAKKKNLEFKSFKRERFAIARSEKRIIIKTHQISIIWFFNVQAKNIEE
jgi:hypothetical protein